MAHFSPPRPDRPTAPRGEFFLGRQPHHAKFRQSVKREPCENCVAGVREVRSGKA